MLLIWALFPAALLAVCGLVLVVIVGIIRAIRKGRSSTSCGATVPVLGCTTAPLCILLAVLFGLPLLVSIRPATSDFEEAFGKPPIEQITNLRGRTDSGPDWRTIFLSFDDNPGANSELVEAFATALPSPETDRLGGEISDGNAPPWFETACQGRSSAEYTNWHQWRSVVIVRCAPKKKIYALFTVVD